jgi:SAM-dependent methyltransferase
MERYQFEFLAATSAIWTDDFPFTGDALYAWSRQWEYPYCVLNLGTVSGRVLDAGSGITFFPFFLATRQYEVHCCDNWSLVERGFEQARKLIHLPVQFKRASITELAYSDSSFDAVYCLSVLEHLPAEEQRAAISEFARVLRPGARLIVTCDISLGRDSDIKVERFAVLLSELLACFEPVYPLELQRPPDLLTTDLYRDRAAWRLPWRPYPPGLRNWLKLRVGKTRFHSLAVAGLTLAKVRTSQSGAAHGSH